MLSSDPKAETPQQKLYSEQVITSTIRLFNRLIVVDLSNKTNPAKQPSDFFKQCLLAGSHTLMLKMSDNHTSVEVKLMCMEHLAFITAQPEIHFHIKMEQFIKSLSRKVFFPMASFTGGDVNCQAYAIQCLNNLSCSETLQFEEILLSTTSTKKDLILKFAPLIRKGYAQIANQMIQLVMRFFSTTEGRKLICAESELIDQIITTCYQEQSAQSLQQSDGLRINKDHFIIFLHMLFDYDEMFFRDRAKQALMLSLYRFL